MMMRKSNPRSTSGTRTALALALVAAVAACGGDPGGAAGGSGAGSPEASADAAAQGSQQTGEAARYDISSLGYNAGEISAPVRVVEFSDFACPHCQAFHLNSYPTLHEEYVETGRVVWKYIPFASGSFPASVHAARAGECAIEQGGEAFPLLRDRIFEEQANWVNAGNPTSLILEYAEEEGLDVDQLSTCIEEGRRDELLQANIEVARRIGLQSTPTFIIGDVVVPGNQPIEMFRDIFDGMIAEQSVGTGADADSDETGGDGGSAAESSGNGA